MAIRQLRRSSNEVERELRICIKSSCVYRHKQAE